MRKTVPSPRFETETKFSLIRGMLLSVKVIVVAVLIFSSNAFSEETGKTNPPPQPGIFGVGFTNVTGSSARLVFTTSEPMATTVNISSNDPASHVQIPDESYLEIHGTQLKDLVSGLDYRISIKGVTHSGTTVVSDDIRFKPVQKEQSKHQWPGFTIFGTTTSEIGDSEYDLIIQSGARMVRIEISWYDLFPKGREMNRSYMDNTLRHIAELKKRGIETLVVLDYCVPWAKQYTNATMTWRHPAFGPPDRLEDWEFYLREVIKALHGTVKYYEIWNEPDAGYLATGRYIERPNLPAPIGRAPFKDNWNYWLGDRFVPMIERVRAVMDELQPDAVLMNGGWNRDYSGQRGDLLFERGAAPYLDVYAFHTYCAQPMSFSSWHRSADGGFRKNIDRIFDKHHVKMPLAVTEWGWPAWENSNLEKGFVTYEDAQKFLVKSAFYFLGAERFEILINFSLGIGPDTRDRDPYFFMLVNHDAQGTLVFHPTFQTFRWLANTFGSHLYRTLTVHTDTSKQLKAYAIQLKETGDVYLAIWQDGALDDKGAIASMPGREVKVSLGDLPAGDYLLAKLDVDGRPVDKSPARFTPSVPFTVSVPEISASNESGIYIAKISLCQWPNNTKK